MAMDRMLAGRSTRRRYQIGLEPVGQQVTEVATATSRSAVSRKLVTQTQTALAELLSADLSTLDLVALLIDGVHFAESCCVVALGIDLQGTKHPLALVEGSTENATGDNGPARRTTRPPPGRHPADPGRARWQQRPTKGRRGRL